MRLISQSFYALISLALTGTLALGVWWMIQKICNGRYPGLVYLTLRIVCLLYLVPVVYFLMRLTVRDGYVQREGLWSWDFLFTGVLWTFGAMAGLLWLSFAAYNLTFGVRRTIRMFRWLRTSFPVDDAAVTEEFRRVTAKLKIRGRIRLRWVGQLNSPMICGTLFCTVLLPYHNFTREELSVIFHHELTHYRQGDRLFGLLDRIIRVFFGISPVYHKFMEAVDEWSEVSCDSKAIAALEDEMGATDYFRVITNIMEKISGQYGREEAYVMLYENHLRLERRMNYMEQYSNRKQITKGAAALAAFAFVLTSVSTTYAAGVQISEVHDYIYEKVEVTSEETVDEDGEVLREYYLPSGEDDTYESLVYAVPEDDGIAPLLDANDLVAFNWSVKPGTRFASREFYVESGRTINISATTVPNDVVFWIGIMDKWNNVRYVEGTQNLSHNFAITSSGNYSVFVQNRGTVQINSAGGYYYY